MIYFIKNTYLPELLDVIREWIEQTQPPDASELLRLVERRRAQLAKTN